MRSETGGRRGWVLVALAIVGIGLRLLMVRLGNNADMETLHEIAAAPLGTNFYRAHPYRANWGPILYWIFQGFYRLPGGNQIATFHLYLAILYSLCDVFSAWVLLRTFGLLSAGLFLFTPAEAIVAGYHGNAEPAVIAAVMAALYFCAHSRSRWKDELFYLFIGVSLAMKHAFVFFPLWLAIRPATRGERIRAVLIPYGAWLIVALPYLIPNPSAWLRNVLLYSSFSGNGLIPRTMINVLSYCGIDAEHWPPHFWFLFFVLPLISIGWLARNFERKHLLMLYAPALVGLSSAIALQYLALPSFGFAARPTVVSWIYNLFSLYQLAGHPKELHLYALPVRLALSVNNPGWHFLQLMCLIWVYRELSRGRRSERGGVQTKIEG